MKIDIKSIPHQDQRYETCGDWFYIDTGELVTDGTLCIRVSQLSSRREMLLIAIHELIEAVLCEQQGVSPEEVDQFDLNFQGPGEPGDAWLSPYYSQHQIATGIERILATELEVNWLEYEKHLEELSK
jgi:hypothetical protein